MEENKMNMFKNIDKNRYTPMIRQYLDIKEKYQDILIFYRVGDFYELFFNDAIIGSRELEIVLTGKDAGVEERIPMCGVPYHAVDGYIEKLSEKGYKVAIVEQMEDPALAKNIVKRDVIRIITPGTNIDQNYLNEKNTNYIGELEKIGNEYVLAYTDLSTGNNYLTTFGLYNDIVINELLKLDIKELIVSPSFNKILVNQLTKIHNVVISYNENTDVDSYLDNLFTNINSKYLIASKRLINYIINTQKRILVHLQPFVVINNFDYLHLNNNAIKNLELIENLDGNRHQNNLFAILDKCSTAMGSRTLKRAILYPLIDIKKINKRLDFIEELLKNPIDSQKIRDLLLNVYDLERIIGRISFGYPNPKELLQLKRSLEVVPKIKERLIHMKTPIAKELADSFYDFSSLYNELNISINEDSPMTIKEGGVIKAGYSEELDRTRDLQSNNKEYLMNLEQRERERSGIKTLKVGYNRVFGYYIEVTKSYLNQVTDDLGYIRKQTTSNSERYITEELKERETLILRSEETALNLERELFDKVKNQCRDNTTELQKLAKTLANIDMIQALSRVAKENNYVRPTFSHYDEIEIIDGRHPVIEKVSDKAFIPNDLKLYNDERILLITGPNMSGKSTFMRQNALIIIMAQMGSYVPATSAKLPIIDKIFTRIGSSDNIAGGESTFMSEMLEVNAALSNATPRSLIILDEVGHGTATFDGMALAQAIIEYIHDEIGAKTLFSTHYHELTNLDKSLSLLRNVHVEANTENFDETGELVFLHKVLPGPSDQSYGVNVARLANIPTAITYRANDILTKLKENENVDFDKLSKDNYVKPVIIDKLPKEQKEVIDELKELDTDSLKPLDALIILNKLKEKLGE